MKRAVRGIKRVPISIQKPPRVQKKQQVGAGIQKIPFEFTTTATCRISLIKQTYDSFYNKLTDVDWKASTLYINIDPIGNEGTPEEIIEVCKGYFGNVVSNTPKECNFTSAIKWLWQQPKGNVFFNLEEDWILKIPIRVQNLMRLLTLNGDFDDECSKFVVATIRAYRASSNDVRICLSPGVMLTQWAKYVSGQMDIFKNPEQQCRSILPKKYKGIQFPTQRNSIAVYDIGRPWMAKNCYHRGAKTEMEFVNWTR